MLPPFTEDGVLPPGIHAATWHEVVERFGGSPGRKNLLDGLRHALTDLRAAGCHRVYLNGSFVTDKENPGDYDMCWDEEGVDFDALPAVLVEGIGDRQRLHDAYAGDIFPVGFQPGFAAWTVLELFQLRKRGYGFKGVVCIELEDQDD